MHSMEDNTHTHTQTHRLTATGGGGYIVQMRSVHSKCSKALTSYSVLITSLLLSLLVAAAVFCCSMFFSIIVLIDSYNLALADDSQRSNVQRKEKKSDEAEACYKKWKCITNSFHACALALASQATHIHAHTPFLFSLAFVAPFCICVWELEINPFADISLQSLKILTFPLFSLCSLSICAQLLSSTMIPSERIQTQNPIRITANKNWKMHSRSKSIFNCFDFYQN